MVIFYGEAKQILSLAHQILCRASLATLDFMPMNTVDYSGGMIITDWYNDGSNDDSLKITVRFLSNEIRSIVLK